MIVTVQPTEWNAGEACPWCGEIDTHVPEFSHCPTIRPKSGLERLEERIDELAERIQALERVARASA